MLVNLVLVGKYRYGVDLNFEVGSTQRGHLHLGAGGECSGKAFEADLAGGGAFPQVGDKTGHLDYVGQSGAVLG